MGVILMIGQLLLSLSLLVVIHELGHYLAARAFGIKVEKFYLFMDAWGFKLFKYKYKDCEYGIGWLPLGGYVKISGMVDESMDKENAIKAKEQYRDYDYNSKPIWQRSIVLLGGVILNVVLAVLIFWGIYFFNGSNHIDNQQLTQGIYPDSLAQNYGFKKGDVVYEVNGKPIKYFEEIYAPETLISESVFSVKRDGKLMEIHVDAPLINEVEKEENIVQFIKPRRKISPIKAIRENSVLKDTPIQVEDKIVSINGQEVQYIDELVDIVKIHRKDSLVIGYEQNGILHSTTLLLGDVKTFGVEITEELPKIKKSYGVGEAFTVGLNRGGELLSINAKALGEIISGNINPQKALTGPVGMARMFGDEVNWDRFWFMKALISLALAFFNVLPIPGLDGGHLFLLGIEFFMGRPLSPQIQYRIQSIGMFIILALLVFIVFSDINKIV